MLRFEILPLEVLDNIFKIVEDEEKEEKEKNFYKTKFKYVLKELKHCYKIALFSLEPEEEERLIIQHFFYRIKKEKSKNKNITRFIYKKNYSKVLNHLNYIFSHFGERYNYFFNATKLFKNHKRKLKTF